jgi:hypothetical protein
MVIGGFLPWPSIPGIEASRGVGELLRSWSQLCTTRPREVLTVVDEYLTVSDMPVVRGTSLSGYPRLVADLGGDADGLLRATGIRPVDVGEHEVFLPRSTCTLRRCTAVSPQTAPLSPSSSTACAVTPPNATCATPTSASRTSPVNLATPSKASSAAPVAGGLAVGLRTTARRSARGCPHAVVSGPTSAGRSHQRVPSRYCSAEWATDQNG